MAGGTTNTKRQGMGRSKRALAVAAAVVAVLIVAAVVIVALLASATLRPPGAAAKYGFLDYLAEDDVTAYIETYRTMSGYSSEEAWAQDLDDEGYTPESFRDKTIRQLVVDALIADKANELDIAVDAEQVEERIQSMKDTIGFGDDELFAQTLALYGRSEQDMRELYVQQMARNAVLEAEVPIPVPTEEEVANYLSIHYLSGLSAKHSYCLKLEGEPSEDSYEKLAEAQQIRKRLAQKGPSKELFAELSAQYCIDDDLRERGGANGWDIDTASTSATYRGIVSDLELGELSNVFVDEGFYYIVWVDDVFTLPDLSESQAGTISLGDYLSDMPDTLMSYFSDCTAQMVWQADCDEYLAKLCDGANLRIFPMPEGLSYDVDMSIVASDDASEEESQ